MDLRTSYWRSGVRTNSLYREILRCVPCPYPAFILAQRDIEHPVQAIFNFPAIAWADLMPLELM